MAIQKNIVKFGSRFAFEFFLETMHPTIIAGVKKYLSSIRTEDIPAMVRKGNFPPLKHLVFSGLGDSVEHIEKISLMRLVEFIAEARPDLIEEIQKMGKAGAEYLVKLRAHLIAKIQQPVEGKEFEVQEDMVMAHCDQCDKKWPVKKEEAAAVTKCPFCGKGGEEGEETAPEEE